MIWTEAGVDQGHVPLVFHPAMPGGEGGDDLACARHRLGIQHGRSGVHVAVVDHLPGTIGIRGPEMVEDALVAVHVFPAHVEEAPVGERPGRVVVLDIAGEHAQVAAVALATVERGHRGDPAIDEPVAAVAAKDQTAVRQAGGLDVVEGTVGDLAEAGAVRLDLVEVVEWAAASSVAEEDGGAIKVHDRIAHCPCGVVEQDGGLPGTQIGLDQLPAILVDPARHHLAAGCTLRRVLAAGLGVEAEVGVPVVGAGHAHGEDDLPHVAQGTVEHGGEDRLGRGLSVRGGLGQQVGLGRGGQACHADGIDAAFAADPRLDHQSRHFRPLGHAQVREVNGSSQDLEDHSARGTRGLPGGVQHVCALLGLACQV